ncbi:MAG TPA: hypothetical protein VEC36_05770 [Patescibacteria group bacterium]|nr:hypothetical protein [Patescibacteria group bacterium]
MTKDKEYQVSIGKTIEKDLHELTFEFQTLREFTTFQYNLQIEDSSMPANNHFQFKIGGMVMPLTAMPHTGHATARIKFPCPADGTYFVEFLKKNHRNMFRIEISAEDMKIIELPEDKQFVELMVKRD